MNNVKFRPVGQSGPITIVRIGQCKEAIFPRKKQNAAPSLRRAHHFMASKNHIRVNRAF